MTKIQHNKSLYTLLLHSVNSSNKSVLKDRSKNL